jgi:hypothetical protein
MVRLPKVAERGKRTRRASSSLRVGRLRAKQEFRRGREDGSSSTAAGGNSVELRIYPVRKIVFGLRWDDVLVAQGGFLSIECLTCAALGISELSQRRQG